MRWTKDNLNRAAQLATEGNTCQEIVDKLKLNTTAHGVRIKLNKNGITTSTFKVKDVEALHCLQCGVQFTAYRYEERKFCTQSCSATYNNIKSAAPPIPCENCDKPIPAYRRSTRCSSACFQAVQQAKTMKAVKLGKTGTYSTRTAKAHLITTQGLKCSCCELTTWNDKPIPIELDHIDGNAENNDLSNLRLLCPNCHAQTATYKGRNIGNGRHKRRQRYHEGKSY